MSWQWRRAFNMVEQPKIKPLNFLKISIVWSVASIVLMVLFIGSLYFQKGGMFFAMLNGINIFSFALVVVFRRKIQNVYAWLRNDYENIVSSKSMVRLDYHYESILGISIVVPTLLFGTYAMWLAFNHIDAYLHLIQEDGLVEYISASCWFLAAIILLIGSAHQIPWKKRCAPHFLPYISMLVFFIVCGGEEISWGQRYFGFKTPRIISAINLQHEANLHDIGSISVFSNAFFFLTLIFFLYLPHVARKHRKLVNPMLRFFFPISHRRVVQTFIIGLAIWLVIGIRFGTLGFHPFSFYAANYYTQMDDEIFEMFAAYSFLAFSVMNCVRNVHVMPSPASASSIVQ
jgi:hypothetical protein